MSEQMFQGKVALVTGGAGGLGLTYVKELLRNGIKGVTVVDYDGVSGKAAEHNLKVEFGEHRIIFLETDVSNKSQLKDAFETSLKHWGDLHILINNAGTCNETNWEKTVSLNCSGTVHGTLLGFQYMSKLKGGHGGVIVNISSIAATETPFFMPTYAGTKSFVLSFSRSFGHRFYYDHNHVKVIGICPGLTDTPIVQDIIDKCIVDLGPNMRDELQEYLSHIPLQSVENVGKHVIALINSAENGTVWVIENDELPYEIYKYNKSDLRTKPTEISHAA